MMKILSRFLPVLSILFHNIEALRIVYCKGRELRTDMDTASIRCDSGSEMAVLNTTCQLYCPETYDPHVQFFKCHLFGWFPTTAPKCSQNSSVTLMIVPAMLGSIALLFVISFSVAMYKRRQRRRRRRGSGDDEDTEAGRSWKAKRRLHYLKTNPALAKDLSDVREKTNKDSEQPDTKEKIIKIGKKLRSSDDKDKKAKKSLSSSSSSRRFTKMLRRRRKCKVSVWAKMKMSTRNKGKKLSDFRQRSAQRWRHRLRKRPPKQPEQPVQPPPTSSSESSSYTDCTSSSSSDESSSCSDCSEDKIEDNRVQVQIETAEQPVDDAEEIAATESLAPPPLEGKSVSMTPSKTLEKAVIDKILIETVISKGMDEEPPTPRDIEHYKAKPNHHKIKKKNVVIKPEQQGYDNYNTSAHNRQYYNFENDYRRKGESYFDGRSYQPSHTVNTVQEYPMIKHSTARQEEARKAKKEEKKKTEASNSTTVANPRQRHGVKYFSIKPSKTNAKLEKYKGPSRYAPRVVSGHKEARGSSPSKVRRVTRDKEKRGRDEEGSRRRRRDSKKRNDRDRSKSRKRRRRRDDSDSDSPVEQRHNDNRPRNREEDKQQQKQRHRDRSSSKQRHHRSYRNKNYDASPPRRRHRKDRHEDEGARRKRSHKRRNPKS